jgi:putative endonuclease
MGKSTQNNRSIGAMGEEFAISYLQNKGYVIREQNYRVGKIGEIDIIAFVDNTLCFIEVKSRKSLNYGMPSESVNQKKIHKLRVLASIYLKNIDLTKITVRFDVIEIHFGKNTNDFFVKNINHIQNAF